jgi:hypothetical protein
MQNNKVQMHHLLVEIGYFIEEVWFWSIYVVKYDD